MTRLKELLSDNASFADDLESYAFQIEGFIDPEDEERTNKQLRCKYWRPGPHMRNKARDDKARDDKARDDKARESGCKALAKKRGKS